MPLQTDLQEPWSIILAGGDERHARSCPDSAGMPHVPKPYREFGDRRAMLESTLRRAIRVSGAARMVTIVEREHASLSDRLFATNRWGARILQPRDRETGPELL